MPTYIHDNVTTGTSCWRLRLFKEFKDNKKSEKIQHDGFVFSLIGISIVIFFTVLDESIIGLEGTRIWRIAGLAPMIVFIVFHYVLTIRSINVKPVVFQWLGTSIIAGIAVMMSAMLFLALKQMPEMEAIAIAGTIGGNLLGIFSVVLFHGINPVMASSAVALPYSALSLLLVFQKEISSVQWLYVGNVIAAIILVTITLWQNEKSDNHRLYMLFELQQKQENMEKKVAERTRELGVLIQELHHRVRNNLQIILSVINLYENEYPGGSNDKRLQMIQKVIFIIEYTYHFTHYAQIEKKVCMQSFLDEICTYSYAPDRTVIIEKDIEKILIDTDIAIIIGFICIHLISNVEKHCRLALCSEEDGVLLTIVLDKDTQIPEGDIRITDLLAVHINGKASLTESTGGLIFNMLLPLQQLS